jgi:outer membrane protein assembly factor BamB
MKNSIVRLIKKNEIAIFDPVNAVIQFFSMEGAFLDSVHVEFLSSDFGVYENNVFLTPIIGRYKFVVIERRSGNVLRTFESHNELNPFNEGFPFPMRKIEIASDGKIFVVTTDTYVISRYSVDKGKEITFGFLPELILIQEAVKERWIEKAPLLKGRIRKYHLPITDINIDRGKDILWITATSDDTNGTIFDLFNKTGEYLQSFILKDTKGNLMAIDNGRMVFFDPNSLRINIFNILALDY